VHKPSGLLAIPGKHEPDSVVTRVRALYPEATGTLMVHRLDMDTSGLMIVSLSREAQRALAIQFEDHVVEKLYIALLGGEVVGEGGTVRLASRLSDTIIKPEVSMSSRCTISVPVASGYSARTRVTTESGSCLPGMASSPLGLCTTTKSGSTWTSSIRSQARG